MRKVRETVEAQVQRTRRRRMKLELENKAIVSDGSHPLPRRKKLK